MTLGRRDGTNEARLESRHWDTRRRTLEIDRTAVNKHYRNRLAPGSNNLR